jgi:predicted TIM-barrel enzyme
VDKLAVIDSLFGVPRALIGVVHLQALPGTPAGKLDTRAITSIAVQEAREYEDAGFHRVMIENTHDRPYLKAGVGPEITAAMAVIGAEIRNHERKPPALCECRRVYRRLFDKAGRTLVESN